VLREAGTYALLGSLAVPDSDAVVCRALEAGAVELPSAGGCLLEHGERCIRDPSGNLWLVMQHPHGLGTVRLRERIESVRQA
jgi:hypothetical protein